MTTYTLNPLTDTRWSDLLRRHPLASVFHSSEWLTALKRTYTYEPVVVTTCPPESDLTNGVVFCRIQSLVTGSRWVSLPFSDHCEPLAADTAELANLLGALTQVQRTSGARFFELRPLVAVPAQGCGFDNAARFFHHELELTGNAAELFARLNKNCVQRKISRAEREQLDYQEGQSEGLVNEFYRLMVMTRRRHRLPPQPLRWFRELICCLGHNAKIRLAFKNGRAIAGIITLQFKRTVVYKYGCSDARQHNLGAIQMLLWRSIQEAIEEEMFRFDFGRCDLNNNGLATFKDRWSATRSLLTYWTTPAVPDRFRESWGKALAGRAFTHFPDWLLTTSGRLLYKHLG
jgi:CelD/BcsL family acetyltransferase involved in cellulose biosynthesis